MCPTKDHKRAALLYDKIFIPPGDHDFLDTPPEVTFGDTLGEPPPSGLREWFQYGLNAYSMTNRGMLGYDRYVALCYEKVTVVSAFGSGSFDTDEGQQMAAALKGKFPIADASCLPSDAHPSHVDAYTAVLSNLPLVSEETAWGEILEFRKDKSSLEKSRRFRVWLRDAARASSDAQLSDTLNELMDDYTAALRKHSLKTVASGLTLVAAAGGAALAAGAAGTIVAALSAGIGMVSGTVAWVLKQRCDGDDIKRGKGSEVAVFYEARKRFGSK